MESVRCALPALSELRRLAALSYPLEGCGILLGGLAHDGADALVVDAIPGRNLVQDRAHDRYELDPRDILAAEHLARQRHIDVVGFWHTHPDHPAEPSRFDTERAWADYVYVICSTTREGVADTRFWRLRFGGEFEQLAVLEPD
ncbi:MAG TPA: M67 family metallopeptidase [Candidatus Angelobacter sp.]|nr:M67 family metallopeptidase [Candidatus Angelobacter sp.]